MTLMQGLLHALFYQLQSTWPAGCEMRVLEKATAHKSNAEMKGLEGSNVIISGSYNIVQGKGINRYQALHRDNIDMTFLMAVLSLDGGGGNFNSGMDGRLGRREWTKF
ncbi:hypothetical protein DFH09DRAFT_1092403 [Mycena vulgaris]|nr:hypothetical protein DFH09DRAFT_1092403 [Mycena vulgaris]